MNRVSAIILAAGKSQRMGLGKNKVLTPLADKTVLEWSLALFSEEDAISEIIVAASAADMDEVERVALPFSKVKKIVEGGDSRQQSVLNALSETSPNLPFIAVHDGARPLLRGQDLHNVIYAAGKERGAVLSVPVKDTIKEVGDGNRVRRTLPREILYSAQTPQVFPRELLLAAYREAVTEGRDFTDDSSLVENFGGEVIIVHGSYENIKLTTREDFILAELLIKNRG